MAGLSTSIPTSDMASSSLLFSSWRSTVTVHPKYHNSPSGTYHKKSLLLNCRGPLNALSDGNDDEDDDDDEEAFLMKQLARIEAMAQVTTKNNNYGEIEDYYLDDDNDFSDLFDDDGLLPEDEDLVNEQDISESSAKILEVALLQGVVPAGAGVGSQCLPGDWGFDPMNLATRDYIGQAQRAIQQLVPSSEGEYSEESASGSSSRPSALVLRDYREAEIRHGRLAMLASLFWPLQEMIDRLLLDEDQFSSPLLYSTGITLPYIPLSMTAIMLLLGYLDVYSQATKDLDKIGEAFLPGDCFWDPLSMLQGAPDTMKRNMQERELFNGRMAMLAVAVYFWEELTTHVPLIAIESNALLFEPAYEIPFVQHWLDLQFGAASPLFTFPKSSIDAVVDAFMDMS